MGRSHVGQMGGWTIALWIVGAWLPLAAWAGWVIEQVEYANPGAEGAKTFQYISKDRLKTVGEGNTFIMDFARDTFIATDQRTHVYWSGTVDEYVQEVQKFHQAANDLTRQHMEQALKETPPAQRKAMEEILQQMRNAGTAQHSAKQPHVKVEATSETATMAGHSVTKFIVFADGKPYQEVWLAKGAILKGDLDLKRMRRLQGKLMQAVMADLPSGLAIEQAPAYEMMLEQGYPMKIVELGEGGEPESVTEVVRLEQRDLPDKEFQPPEGYQRINLREFFREELERLRRGN